MQQRKKEKAFVDATSYIESLNESSFDPFKSFWCQQRFAALQLEKSTVTSSWNVVLVITISIRDYFWVFSLKWKKLKWRSQPCLIEWVKLRLKINQWSYEAKNRVFEFDYQKMDMFESIWYSKITMYKAV